MQIVANRAKHHMFFFNTIVELIVLLIVLNAQLIAINIAPLTMLFCNCLLAEF